MFNKRHRGYVNLNISVHILVIYTITYTVFLIVNFNRHSVLIANGIHLDVFVLF